MEDIPKVDQRSPKRRRRDARVKAMRKLDKDGFFTMPTTTDQAPTKRQKTLYAKITEKAETISPEEAINQALGEVYGRDAISRNRENILQTSGLQKLIKEAEAQGLTHKNYSKRLADGVFTDNLNTAHKYSELWARLRYPEAFRSNINIDNRQVNQYSNLSDEEIATLLKDDTTTPNTDTPV